MFGTSGTRVEDCMEDKVELEERFSVMSGCKCTQTVNREAGTEIINTQNKLKTLCQR